MSVDATKDRPAVFCCVCGKIRLGEHWYEYMGEQPELVSHGYCPEHLREAYESLRALRKKNGTETSALS